MTRSEGSPHNPTPRELICHAGAGAAAGTIAATFVCPLDVIKTRLQVHGLPATPNSGRAGSIIVTSLQNIVRTEGVKGLYRGLSPTIIALLPNWAVYFSTYEHLKGLLVSHGGGDGQLTVGANMIAASGAGAATCITTNPLWVVKTRLQTQGMRPDVIPYKSILSALRRIVHEEGFRGLYSGILPSLAGVSHVAIQFPAYEKIKCYIAKKHNTTVDNLSPKHVAIASSMAKVLASLMTYPHEVVRSRLQEQGLAKNSKIHYAGVVDCVKKVFQKEGMAGFYRGCATNLMRTTPSAIITFTSYEMIHRFLDRTIPPDKKHPQAHRKSDKYEQPPPPRETEGDRIGNNIVLGQSQSQSQSQTQTNNRVPTIPTGKKDQLTAAP